MLKKSIPLLAVVAALSGCEESMQNMQDGLNKYDNFISGKAFTQKKPEKQPPKKPAKNFGITDSQAMTYLSKDDSNYLLKASKWTDFWSYHIHYKTPLFKKADKYCGSNIWEGNKTGSNCGDFNELVVLVRGQEMTSQDFGHS